MTPDFLAGLAIGLLPGAALVVLAVAAWRRLVRWWEQLPLTVGRDEWETAEPFQSHSNPGETGTDEWPTKPAA